VYLGYGHGFRETQLLRLAALDKGQFRHDPLGFAVMLWSGHLPSCYPFCRHA
jgi:hypothetical protein